MRKILFDHCVSAHLRPKFRRRIKVTLAIAEGLNEVVNSTLEKAAYDLGYYALITTDKGFEMPGHIPEFHIPVVLLRAIPVRGLDDLIPIVEEELLAGLEPGVYVRDNFYGTILSSGSSRESENLREPLKEERRKARRVSGPKT